MIANLILTFGEPVNILKADTKNVGGVAKGEMILEFMEGSTRTEMMKQYLKEKGLPVKVNVTTVEEAADEIMQALEKKI